MQKCKTVLIYFSKQKYIQSCLLSINEIEKRFNIKTYNIMQQKNVFLLWKNSFFMEKNLKVTFSTIKLKR